MTEKEQKYALAARRIRLLVDIDSKNYAAFDEIDAAWLERICGLFDRD